MAPNRKNIVSLDLPAEVEGLRNTVQAKYLPLTDPREQEQNQNEQVQPKATDASESYWEWPADTQAIEEEENKVAHIFSVQHIESNLIKDAQKYVSSPSNKMSEHDEYWADESQVVDEEQQTPKKPQHVSDGFWYWPANEKIYKEEQAQRLTSTSNIESNLRSSVNRSEGSSNGNRKDHDGYWTWDESSQKRIKDIPSRTVDPSPSFDYWTWDTISPEDEKKKIIETILEEERIRQLLSSEHIEEQLRNSSFQLNNKESHAVLPPVSATGGYWDW
jgi:hypothetical protein